MADAALLESSEHETGSHPFRLRLERTANATQTDQFVWAEHPYPIEGLVVVPDTVDSEGPALFDQIVGLPETVDARTPAQFGQVVARRARELTKRVVSHLAGDLEAADDVIPTRPASEACQRLIRRMAPHVALASRLKVAAFTEDSSGVSLVLQSLLTDRRLNFRIAPDGASISAICTDEYMDVEVQQVRDDDPDLPRELAEWVVTADDIHRLDDTFGQPLDRRLADVIGAIAVGGSSRKTGRAFTSLLARPGTDKSPRSEL